MGVAVGVAIGVAPGTGSDGAVLTPTLEAGLRGTDSEGGIDEEVITDFFIVLSAKGR